MTSGTFIGISLAYLGVLFAIAYYADKLGERGRKLTRSPYIYTLSIAVYCTSWTFYGSVGLAANTGLDFLPIYLGPTLMFVLWPSVWLKIVRICKINRITSIADFISSRYGKSSLLGGLVTIVALVGTTPYISLQLKSIAQSYAVVTGQVDGDGVGSDFDTTLLVAMALAVFAILFGTRHIDSSERHEGLVTAIAFESLVKLFAFLSVGFFLTFGIHGGFENLFVAAASHPGIADIFTASDDGNYAPWVTMTLLSMAAIVCLPRQFYVTAVENVDERHLRTAVWLFPLYLLLINIFVLPIAVSGLLVFNGNTTGADMFVLTVPLSHGQHGLTLFAFIGGLSAATSMVIVATIAVSTMVCNNLVMPILIRWSFVGVDKQTDLTGLLLMIRRVSIFVIMLLGYAYFRLASESYSLVTIGLVSFSAVAQFMPAMIGGIFWKAATYRGALTGLALGFAMWLYTLLLPSFAQSGWLPISFIEQGPYGIALLKPYALLGLDGLDRLSHALFWSMLFNVGAFVVVSLSSKHSAIERVQSALFVDVFRFTEGAREVETWQGTVSVYELRDLLGRFIGRTRALRGFDQFARERGRVLDPDAPAEGDLLSHAEKMLAGAIGSATARVMIGTVVKGRMVSMDEMYQVLDETSQVIRYSRMLESKSLELERTTSQLQAANERLKELDQLKDEFLSTISHELRTPLTSIRSFSGILQGEHDVSDEQRRQFMSVIVKESERLTRLINQILDLAKMESGRMPWSFSEIDAADVIHEALEVMDAVMVEKNIDVSVEIEDNLPPLNADRDKFLQVLLNLISNAVKFCDEAQGRVSVRAYASKNRTLSVEVSDNGEGIQAAPIDMIFEKFYHMGPNAPEQPRGTGLGLAICRQIVTAFGGTIQAANNTSGGATITVTLPAATKKSQARKV